MELLLIWIAFAVIVAIAANSRGRNPILWLLLAIIISPLLAALFLFASRNLRHEKLLTARVSDPVDDEALRRSVAIGRKTSRVTIDRSAFEAEGVFAGIPYRVAPDGSIEAMMQGGRVKFRDIDVFMSQVGPPPSMR